MKDKTREDRRVTRTKTSLHQALTDLVKEKGYAAVTIEEITTRANLGRTTFYLHYQDKEDLLLEGLEERLSILANLIAKRPLLLWIREPNGNVVKSIFETVKANSAVFTLITQEQSNKVYDRFRSIIVRVVMKSINESPWAEKIIRHLGVPVDYIVDYFSGAIWASIVWWAGNDFALSTKDMANSFQQLFFPGLLSILNVKEFTELAEINAS